MRTLVAELGLLALLAAGCHGARDGGAPCGTVAGRLFAIARDDLARGSADPATRRQVGDQLPAIRDALAQACDRGGWSAAARTCMVGAADHVAFETCQRELTDDQRRALDRASRGETDSP